MSIDRTETASAPPDRFSGNPTSRLTAGTKQIYKSARTRLMKLTWYLNRLRSMGGSEFGHRLVEQVKRYNSELRSYSWSDFDCGPVKLPHLPIAAFNPEQLQDLQGILQPTYANAQSRSYEFFGVRWPVDAGPDIWHVDPISGKSWPSDIYCFGVPYRDNTQMGDVKYVWELNRLQFLQPVAALSALTNDPEPAEFCLCILDEWIESNPPFQGINWVSGIELALRTISILTVLSFIDPKLISSDRRARLSACLKAHGFWLMRYPSRFSSANNHLIAEAAALYALGTCWPELEEASHYAQYGQQVLSEQVVQQIHVDGVGAEQSPSYTSLTLEWYLLCLWIGDQSGAPFGARVRDQLGKAGHHLRWVMDTDGHVPAIGDDDECGVFACPQDKGEAYVSSVLGSLSAFLDDPDIAPPVVRPHIRDMLFGQAAPNEHFPEGAQTFASGGYTVFRKSIRGKKVLLVLDHGPVGHLSIAAHGHADALAIWLHIDDQPVFVDAGTYLYHSGGAWRDYFRSTRAHNTVAIGEANSSKMTGAFNWGRRAKCQIVAPLKQEDGSWSIVVSHDGYEDDFKVRHQREIRFHCEGKIEVLDRLIGNTANLPPARAGLLVHPDLTVTHADDVIDVCYPTGKLLSVSTTDKQTPLQIESALDENPPQFSGTFGSKEPTCRLALEVNRETHNGAERTAGMIFQV